MLDNLGTMVLEDDRFNLSLSNYEGPIDLLLDLAKKQKVNWKSQAGLCPFSIR